MSDRLERPEKRIVAAQHKLAHADLRHDMADRLRGEDRLIEIDLLEIFRWLFLQLDLGVATAGVDQTGVIGTIGVGRQKTPAMSGDHFQLRKAIERAPQKSDARAQSSVSTG